MKNVDGGRHAQLQALLGRIIWVDGPAQLTLPVLCFALPPKRYDTTYQTKRPYTELGQRCPLQVLPFPIAELQIKGHLNAATIRHYDPSSSSCTLVNNTAVHTSINI